MQNKNPVTFRDVIYYASVTSGNNLAGEFDEKSITYQESSDLLIDRLFQSIEQMVTETAKIHLGENFDQDKNIKPDKQNEITRALTNEFFFYTKRPLTIAEFELLQQKLYALAETQPENLHLILGSFSVLTPDNKIMNVTPFIQCGKNPIVNFTVKNHPSSIDPSYNDVVTDVDPNKYIKFPSVSVQDNISDCFISLNNQRYNFSFENTFECKSMDDESAYHCCIDVCLDHKEGVAKDNLLAKINNESENLLLNVKNKKNILPSLCSHIVISNSINITNMNVMSYENVVHVDPFYTKDNINKEDLHDTYDNPTFGTPYQRVIKKSMVCSALKLEALNKVYEYNQKYQRKYQSNKELEKLRWHDHQNTEAIITSILKGADPNYWMEGSKYTPLMAAVESNNFELVNFLLSADGSLKISMNNGMTAFSFANNETMRNLLINKMTELNHTLVMIDFTNLDNTSIIKNLINQGASANACVPPDFVTPLMKAVAAANNIELVNFLLAQGADLIRKDNNGLTVMDYVNDSQIPNKEALCKIIKEHLNKRLDSYKWTDVKNTQQIKTLIEAGADPNYCTPPGYYTPLMAAVESGNVALVSFLLEHGANPSQKTNNNIYPLNFLNKQLPNSGKIRELIVNHLSENLIMFDWKNSNNTNNIISLFEAGADLNYHFDDDHTPFTQAIAYGNVELVSYLLTNDADILQGKINDQSVFDFLKQNHIPNKQNIINIIKENLNKHLGNYKWTDVNNTQSIKTLIEAGANPNYCTPPGYYTPLMAAVESGNVALVSFLLEQGADPLQKTNNNIYPLNFLNKQLPNNEKIRELITDHLNLQVSGLNFKDHEDLQVIENLIKAGADLRNLPANGVVNLFTASLISKNQTIIQTLLLHEKFDMTRPIQGRPLFNLALSENLQDAAKIILIKSVMSNLKNREKNQDKNYSDYKHSLNLFGKKINLEFSHQEKVFALERLENFLTKDFTERSFKDFLQTEYKSSSQSHKKIGDILNNGETKLIYQQLLQYAEAVNKNSNLKNEPNKSVIKLKF